MPTVEIPIIGPSYRSRSLPIAAQQTINWLPEVSDNGSALHNTPGTTLYTSTINAADRGMHIMDGVLYKVTGTRLYKIDQFTNATDLGEIPGSQRVVFADDGQNLILAFGGKPKIYDSSADTLSEVSDSDLPASVSSVAFLNRKIIYQGEGGTFWVSNVNDPTTIDSDSFATAESQPDDLVRVYSFKQQLYLFGEKTIETWTDTGTGAPPFARVQGSVQSIGLESRDSVASNDQFIYFLGDDKIIYRLRGNSLQRISNFALGDEFRDQDISDAIGITMILNNQNLYILVLPRLNKTYVFHENTEFWLQLSSGALGDRHVINSYARVYGKDLISHYSNGDVLEWDMDVFDEQGDEIRRQRDTQRIDGSLFNEPGSTLFFHRIRLDLETGVATASGEASDAEIAMQFSDDGGKTWSTSVWRSAGDQGDFIREVEWYQLGASQARIFRFYVSDPCKWSLYKMYADIEVGR